MKKKLYGTLDTFKSKKFDLLLGVSEDLHVVVMMDFELRRVDTFEQLNAIINTELLGFLYLSIPGVSI